MPSALLRSPAMVDAFLLALLFVWLGSSAAMTILTGRAARMRAAREARAARRRPTPSLPAASVADRSRS